MNDEKRDILAEANGSWERFIELDRQPNTNGIVRVWTDGSAVPNPGKGGWAALMDYNGVRKLVSGNSGIEQCTNNRAELMAMIVALEALKRPCVVEIVSDSQYAVNMASGAWKPKGNFDLIERLHDLIDAHIEVKTKWVREFTLAEQGIVHNKAEYEATKVTS